MPGIGKSLCQGKGSSMLQPATDGGYLAVSEKAIR